MYDIILWVSLKEELCGEIRKHINIASAADGRSLKTERRYNHGTY